MGKKAVGETNPMDKLPSNSVQWY